jgi:RNA polymerase sigma-70 factor (ECF subfamily)
MFRRPRGATPAERLAFVLHDLFAVPFQDIAEILDRTPASALAGPAGVAGLDLGGVLGPGSRQLRRDVARSRR